MQLSVSRLEDLPNEILSEIFQYIKVKDLFGSFYNLNLRLNTVLECLDNLYLYLSTTDCNQIQRYNAIAAYIQILFIYGNAQLHLKHFTNIRHLILLQASDELLEQLDINQLSCLEHLVIILSNRREETCKVYIWNQIFCNDFPYLKSCCMHKMGFLWTNSPWRQISSLRILKIGDIDLLSYQSILSSCPNLCSFKFTRVLSSNKPIQTVQHMNLKKLIIVIPWFEELSIDSHMNDYFSCVPNLEQLIFHRTNESQSINESFLKFDWYISSIQLYLPLLTRYIYYFHILKSSRFITSNTEQVIHRIQEHFRSLHRHSYRCQLVFDFLG